MVTRQPIKGRRRGGGVRFGEMERDCLLSHGTVFLLQDRLLHGSDKTRVKICTRCGSLLSPRVIIPLNKVGAQKNKYREHRATCVICDNASAHCLQKICATSEPWKHRVLHDPDSPERAVGTYYTLPHHKLASCLSAAIITTTPDEINRTLNLNIHRPRPNHRSSNNHCACCKWQHPAPTSGNNCRVPLCSDCRSAGAKCSCSRSANEPIHFWFPGCPQGTT